MLGRHETADFAAAASAFAVATSDLAVSAADFAAAASAFAVSFGSQQNARRAAAIALRISA